ncbi:dienelactone hydrolase [Ilyonectria robusta]
MHFTQLLVVFCNFLAVAALYGKQPPGIIKHDGKPIGKEVVYDGLTLYISQPKWPQQSDTAVLYLTDVFGIPLLQNRLLADSFARAGFLTITPDLFDGVPAPHDITFDAADFLSKHNVNVTDPIIEKTIEYIRTKLGVKRVAVTGYCFGGRYAFRFLAEGRGVDVGFAAHPSLLQDDEVLAIKGPASVAAAEVDSLLEPARRLEIEGLLSQAAQPFQVNLYSGTTHGFGVRANVSDPEQKFGKEEAFWQAVRWFNAW